MPRGKVLHIISDQYPYGKGEQFFDLEVKEFAQYFDQIVLYPLNKGEGIRDLPANIKVNDSLNNSDRTFGKKQFLAKLFLITRIIGFEFLRSKRKGFILKRLKQLAGSVIQCSSLADVFYQEVDSSQDNYYYSFWMNDGALLLSILKQQKRINQFDFRVNGFDIFDERHEGLYMPFRFYNYKHVRSVLVLSIEALNYLKEINYKPEKLRLSHYGVMKKGLNPFEKKEVIQIVSCSNMIPLKRIDKIIDGLSLLDDFQVKWTHFGDGVLRDRLVRKAKDLPKNIKVLFRGSVKNTEIMKLYENECINAFIHTSETEGLGMAIIEAQCYGIPAIVVGVGGVLDIVSDSKTGVVLNPTAEGKEVAEGIRTVLNGEMNTAAYRQVIQNHCMDIFDAVKNYRELGEHILKN